MRNDAPHPRLTRIRRFSTVYKGLRCEAALVLALLLGPFAMRYTSANPDISTLRGELPVPTDWGLHRRRRRTFRDDVDLELSTGVSQSASSTKKKEAAKAAPEGCGQVPLVVALAQ